MESDFTQSFRSFYIGVSDVAFQALFLDNKFVKAVNIAKNSVSFSHIFSSRGLGVTFEDLSEFSAEELSLFQGDVFMTNTNNEFYKVFNPMAVQVQGLFPDYLETSICASVSVMKLTNLDIHCDDSAVGDQIVIVNCGDEEYDLLFYTAADKDVYLGKLTVLPWMMYLLTGDLRLAYHEVQNAVSSRIVVRLGFFEASSIHEYLVDNPPQESTQQDKEACKTDRTYKRNLQQLRTNPDKFFGVNITALSTTLGPSSFLESVPRNSRHGFLYFDPGHVRDIIGTTLLELAKTSVLELVQANQSCIRNWSYDDNLQNYSWALVAHFEGLQPSRAMHDINESISRDETKKRRSQILNLDLIENRKHRDVFKAIAQKVYNLAIPDFVKESVDFPNVLFDININLFSAVYTPGHKDEALYQAPGVIVVNVYLSKHGSFLMFQNQFTGHSYHRRIEGFGMHVFFADLYAVCDHAIYSLDTLVLGNLVPLDINNLDDARIVLTFRFGYSKFSDEIVQRTAFWADPFDFQHKPSDLKKAQASTNANQFLWNMNLSATPLSLTFSTPSFNLSTLSSVNLIKDVEDEDNEEDVKPSSLPASSSISDVTSDLVKPSSLLVSSSISDVTSDLVKIKGWIIEYTDSPWISWSLYRCKKITRSTDHSKVIEQDDIFCVVDDDDQKEIVVLAILRVEGATNRVLTLCTTRDVGAEWDDDYFVSNALRFFDDNVVKKTESTVLPLSASDVDTLVATRYGNQKDIKETSKTNRMWNRIFNKVKLYCSVINTFLFYVL